MSGSSSSRRCTGQHVPARLKSHLLAAVTGSPGMLLCACSVHMGLQYHQVGLHTSQGKLVVVGPVLDSSRARGRVCQMNVRYDILLRSGSLTRLSA